MIQELKTNLSQPDNKRWKIVANYLLYTGIPAINVFFVAMQVTGEFSPKLCFWGVAGTNLVITLFKGLSKFTAEPDANVD